MTTLQFVDTHNMVAFLSKPDESEVIEQIVDFLNANPIRYALTINPTIYTSCIEQFWATAKVKTVNGEVHLQALVDGKKIIITEASVRRDLQLNDEDGTDCLPNATIFKELTRMGYEKLSQKLTFYKAFFSPQWKFLINTILQCLSAKTTAWNEFSITMASEIICLATNQKFNFSKYIFESMVKNLDNVGKFFMYPRFVQVFLKKQLEGMQSHKRIYDAPSHTKKIFRNIKRVGKGFSGRETPLFPTMVVQNQAEMGEGSTIPTDPHHTPIIIQPSTSLPQKKQRSRRPKIKDIEVPQPSSPTTNVANEAVNEEMDNSLEMAATTATSLVAEQYRGGGPMRQETMGDTIAQTGFKNVSKLSNDPLLARGNTLRSGKDSLKLKELIELCAKSVKRLEKKGGSRTHGLKRLYKVGLSRRVESSDEEGLGEEDASKQGMIADIDADAGINLVSTHFDADTDMFGVHDLDGDEVLAEPKVTIKDVNLSVDEVTLAQALETLKTVSTRPKAKGLVIHEQEQAPTPTISSQQLSQVKIQDKSKGIMVEEPMVEQVKPMKRLEQMRLDEELTSKLQAKEEEEERLAREKAQ
ncbi:hypothetical protein Tco_0677314 [Tanacetum coccineum]|uniref:Uncharacterized protein n=1 Tax=Tanacetum coccineum TaxID=301880 RepID=A0ABQ4XCJ6_9ASTR